MTSQGELKNRFYYERKANRIQDIAREAYDVHDGTGRFASSGTGTIMCSGVSLETAEKIVNALNRDAKLNNYRAEADAAARRRALANAPYATESDGG
jgi:hypothetical protein